LNEENSNAFVSGKTDKVFHDTVFTNVSVLKDTNKNSYVETFTNMSVSNKTYFSSHEQTQSTNFGDPVNKTDHIQVEHTSSVKVFSDFADFDLPIGKTVNSSRPQMIFFAGLAYSGQDQLESALEKACKEEPGRCFPLCGTFINSEIFYGRDIEEFSKALAATETSLIKLAAEAQEGNIYFGNLYGNCNKTTYPDVSRYGKSDRSQFHPDLVLLAETADKSGWDLEIIVLLQDVEILGEMFIRNQTQYGISNDKSRKDIAILKVMEMSMQNLYAQLAALGKEYYRCVQPLRQESHLDEIIGLKSLGKHLSDITLHEVHSSNPLPSGSLRFLESLKFLKKSIDEMCNHKISNIADNGNILKKTVVSSSRLVFFAGMLLLAPFSSSILTRFFVFTLRP